ncbi:1520_t:CDS:1, partial [Cetraspora pellucida]
LASDNKNEIKKQFLNADETVKTSSITPQEHSNHMNISKIINIQNISSAIKVSKSIELVEIST